MTGRRERNKIQRRKTIQLVGLQLFAEQGYDQTTIADIAEAADVALRTVSLYYPTKLDIALSAVDEIYEDLFPTLAAHGSRDTLIDILEQWLRRTMAERDREMLDLLAQAYKRTPELEAQARTRTQPNAQLAVALLTKELGGADDMVNLVGTLIRVAVNHLLMLPATADTERVVTTTMAFLRAGIAAIR